MVGGPPAGGHQARQLSALQLLPIIGAGQGSLSFHLLSMVWWVVVLPVFQRFSTAGRVMVSLCYSPCFQWFSMVGWVMVSPLLSIVFNDRGWAWFPMFSSAFNGVVGRGSPCVQWVSKVAARTMAGRCHDEAETRPRRWWDVARNSDGSQRSSMETHREKL